MKFGIRLGKVVKVNYDANTVDCFLENGGGMVYGASVAVPLATTNSGIFELPVLKTVKHSKAGGSYQMATGATVKNNDNLYQTENNTLNKVDLEDPESQYAYAVLALFDEAFGKTNSVCLGFVFPFRNQMIFDPENVDLTNKSLEPYVKEAIKKLKGGLLHRTNSGVYWTVDLDGNTEWSHPNGSFIRFGERPTQDEDGQTHVDLTGGNRKAVGGKASYQNMRFDTSKVKGSDGSENAGRKLNAHLEFVTEKGTVEIDINKKTGNVTIRTPKETSGGSSSNNQVTIIAGGDATIQSVEGDVTIQSAKEHIQVQAGKDITVKTDGAADHSILLAPNASNVDYLVLFNKLKDKFNEHTHTCKGTGKQTAKPDKQLDKGDATFVTKAG